MVVFEVAAVCGDHLARGLHQFLAERAGGAVALGDLHQLADHMTPAQLLLQDVEDVVAGVAIAEHEPAELLAEQLLGSGLGAVRVDPTTRGQRA